MENNTNEELSPFFSANDINYKTKEMNSPKNIGNTFFFTITDDKSKDSNNNESNDFFINYQDKNSLFEDDTTNFYTNNNTEEIFGNTSFIPIVNQNIVPIEDRNIVKLFDLKISKKGRKKLSGNKKEHDKHCLDNILTKIQVHFLNFLINLSNDVLKAEFGENNVYNFKHLSYKFKKNVNFNSFIKNKNCAIKELLIQNISSKYSKCQDKNINEKILKTVCEKSYWLNDFFNLKYINVFLNYYYIEDPKTKIEYKGKTIELSKKTKSIFYLFEKNNTQKEEINNIIKQVYLNIKTGYYGQDPFTSKKKKID